MQDFFGNLLGAILITAWIVWGIRIAHRVWNSEDHSGKFLLLIFFFKGTLLYLIFYWIPIQFYLLFKVIGNRGQGTTIRRSHAKDTELLMKIDFIAMKRTELIRIHQALKYMLPDTPNKNLLLSRVEEILKKRSAAGYSL